MSSLVHRHAVPIPLQVGASSGFDIRNNVIGLVVCDPADPHRLVRPLKNPCDDLVLQPQIRAFRTSTSCVSLGLSIDCFLRQADVLEFLRCGKSSTASSGN